MEQKYVKIQEAAKMLGVSKLTLRNWDKAHKLVAYRHPINNYRVYLAEDLEKIKPVDRHSGPPKKPKVVIPIKNSKSYKLKVIHIRD